MSDFLKRWRRRIAVAVLGVGLFVAPALSGGAHAQAPDDPDAPPPVAGEGSGRSLDGYLGTIVLVLLAFFIVGKSARR
jgi:hypothetical protein